MSDAMSSRDEKCEGCINWAGSYNNKPCMHCSHVFSGMPGSWYETEEAVKEMNEELDKEGWDTDLFCPTCPQPSAAVCNICKSSPLVGCGRDAFPLHYCGFYNLNKQTEEQYLTKLIEDHWAYIEKLLMAHDTDKDIIEVAKFHYKSAGIHFWKHAMEYVEEGK